MQRRRIVLLGATLLTALLSVPAGWSTHADGSYDVPNWFEWLNEAPLAGVVTLDVLILPAEHGQVFNGNGVAGGNAVAEAGPCTNSYTRGMTDSTKDWVKGINTFGAAWLKAGLALNIYTVGCDPAPPPVTALRDPEIVVFSDETKTVILGVAVSSRPCLVDNSKFFITSFTYQDMYNINSQEFGHCLGVNHVGGEHPVNDVMNGLYPYNPGAFGNPKNCVSNLDVLGVQEAFEQILGQGAGGATASIAVGAYQQQAC